MGKPGLANTILSLSRREGSFWEGTAILGSPCLHRLGSGALECASISFHGMWGHMAFCKQG